MCDFCVTELLDNATYLDQIKQYDELMAGYKYQVKMWEEDAVSGLIELFHLKFIHPVWKILGKCTTQGV